MTSVASHDAWLRKRPHNRRLRPWICAGVWCSGTYLLSASSLLSSSSRRNVAPALFLGRRKLRRVPPFLLPRFELSDEYSELRRDRSREGVVLVPQSFPDCCGRSLPIAGRIDFALRGTGNDVPTYPEVDPVSCGEKVGHGRFPESLRLLFRAARKLLKRRIASLFSRICGAPATCL
jgi:hypothetical protein